MRTQLRVLAGVALVAPLGALQNGVALTPPRGWRSWNSMGSNVSQAKITAQIRAIAKPFKPAVGSTDTRPVSLLDLGYARAGLDDGWQNCGAGINGSFHSATGSPLVNKALFPNVTAMNELAHALGVRTGWYFQNCMCNEKETRPPNWPPQMHGDTAAIHDLGWDGVKLDGCGPSHDQQQWTDLLNATGGTLWRKEGYLIENCHDNTSGIGDEPGNQTSPGFPYWEGDVAGSTLHCPMNLWRVSRDIRSNWESVMSNLQHVTAFQDEAFPISSPGCWAYPDMLEVGVVAHQHHDAHLSPSEAEAHFYAWCIVSAPLVLGFDLTDTATLASVWPIISNVEALNVSRHWAGHPGRLVMQSPHACSGCDESKRTQPTAHTIAYGFDPTTPLPSWQIWAKKISDDGITTKQAVLLLNLDSKPQTVSTDLENVGITVLNCKARDIGNHKDLPPVAKLLSADLPPRSSRFVLLG